MVISTQSATDKEREDEIADLVRASEAGEFDYVGREAIQYLISRLPDGYALDEDNHVIRLDPGLPDHFYIPSLINGVPSSPVRIPVYTDRE